MTNDSNLRVAEAMLTAIGTGKSPASIARMFQPDAIFEVPGDFGALPWIGRRRGREAVAEFVAENRRLLQPMLFDVQEILASGSRAVVLGALESIVLATGRVIKTRFAIVLTISDGLISHFLMLEDSFHVSTAVRA